MIRHRHRNDTGAIAIMMALLAVVLFGIGAIVVDVGQAWAKRSLLQTNVDLAALAAAAELDGDANCQDARVVNEYSEARDYLTKPENAVPSQETADLTGSSTDADGFIDCEPWKVSLWAPHASVEPGLARVFSDDDIVVPAFAAAGVSSPKTSVWPVYAVAGCDMGPQTLIDPASGHTTAIVPVLDPPSTTANNPRLDGIGPSNRTDLNVAVTISLSGNQLNGVTKVGFTREEPPVDVGGHEEVTLSPANSVNGSIAAVAVPENVYKTEAVWWIRVYKPSVGWSNASSAQAFLVGDPVLRCNAGSTSGNFGVVNLPNSLETGGWQQTATNIANGIQYDLQTYPTAPNGPNPCASESVAVTVDDASEDPVNCLTTQSTTGIATNAITAGLITGDGISVPGLLDADNSELCGGSRWNPSGSYPAINDDRIDCFLNGHSISEVSQYNLPASLEGVIDQAILESPRFMWVPVFSVVAGPGGSMSYAIQDFRPAFLTGADTSTKHNGIELASSGVISLEVVFFNSKALPESIAPGGGTMPYLGVGPKIISLVE